MSAPALLARRAAAPSARLSPRSSIVCLLCRRALSFAARQQQQQQQQQNSILLSQHGSHRAALFSTTTAARLPSSFQSYPLYPQPPPDHQTRNAGVPDSSIAKPAAEGARGQIQQGLPHVHETRPPKHHQSQTQTQHRQTEIQVEAEPHVSEAQAQQSTPEFAGWEGPGAAAADKGRDTSTAASASSPIKSTSPATGTATATPTPAPADATQQAQQQQPQQQPQQQQQQQKASQATPAAAPAAAKRPARASKLRPRKAAIKLTPTAVAHLRALLEGPDPKHIRVGVRNRGCSGLAYQLDYVEEAGKFDEEVEQDGVKVLIDSKALFSIIGSEMDWVEDKLNQRFVFRNPNIKEQCGCGESFMV